MLIESLCIPGSSQCCTIICIYSFGRYYYVVLFWASYVVIVMNLLQFLYSFSQIKPAYVIPDQVSCAVIRYHSRRVTCLEFHPTNNNILLSGDKVSSLYSFCCDLILVYVFKSECYMMFSLCCWFILKERTTWSLGFSQSIRKGCLWKCTLMYTQQHEVSFLLFVFMDLSTYSYMCIHTCGPIFYAHTHV